MVAERTLFTITGGAAFSDNMDRKVGWGPALAALEIPRWRKTFSSGPGVRAAFVYPAERRVNFRCPPSIRPWLRLHLHRLGLGRDRRRP